MTTIKEIASRLGISVSTVSKGLNGASDISPQLRQMVLDTAVEMGYITKKMKKEGHKKLCIFVENMDFDSSNQFGYDLILGFRQAAFRNNWDVTVLPVTPAFQQQEKYDTFMLKEGYSGAFLLGFHLKDIWMPQLKQTTIPTVLLDNFITKNPNVAYIGTDSLEGIDDAVNHLVSLGHTKIAFLNGFLHSMITERRTHAFYSSMHARQLTVDKALVANGCYHADSARDFLPTFLQHGATAVICGSDLIAYGVIQECEKLGMSVPEDLSVIGFDDLPSSAHMDPPLTTIHQNRIDLGKCGYIVLKSLMNQVPVSRTLLRPHFIVRSSTACPPATTRTTSYYIK